jgi:hypothetical protein
MKMSDKKSLYYPIYLDTPMMVSFVAALEGGYALENTLKYTNESSGEMVGQLSGEVGLSKIFTSLAAANIKGSGSLDGKLTKSEESQIILKHTEASLFMRLRDELISKDRITFLDDCDEEKWKQIRASDIVEISGILHLSPINEIIRMAERFIPFMEPSVTQQPTHSNGNKNKSSRAGAQLARAASVTTAPANTSNADGTISLIKGLRADLEASPLFDMLLKHEGQWNKSAVIDLSAEVLSLENQERLRCGKVFVLGKATLVLAPDESISLYRRSIFGYAAQDIITQLALEFNNIPGISVKLEAAAIEYPAVEIVPMAIYV